MPCCPTHLPRLVPCQAPRAGPRSSPFHVMSNATQLKQQARSLEQREQWKAALELYEQMAREFPDSDELEVGVWNRIGDLHMRLAQPEPAISAYESAVDAYAAAGLHNNAIALCNKILRIAPDRATIFFKLGMVSALKGFKADARQHTARYVQLMAGTDRLHEALDTLVQGIQSNPDDDVEVRLVVAEQLQAHGRDQGALDLFRAAHRLLVERGQRAEAERVRDQILALGASDEPPTADAGPSAGTGDSRLASLDEIQLGPVPTVSFDGAQPATVREADAPPASLVEPQDGDLAEISLAEITPISGFQSTDLEADTDSAALTGLDSESAFATGDAGILSGFDSFSDDAEDDDEDHDAPPLEGLFLTGSWNGAPVDEDDEAGDEVDSDEALPLLFVVEDRSDDVGLGDVPDFVAISDIDTTELPVLGSGRWDTGSANEPADLPQLEYASDTTDGSDADDGSLPLLELTDWSMARGSEVPSDADEAETESDEPSALLRDATEDEDLLPAHTEDLVAADPVALLAARIEADPAGEAAVAELTAMLLAGDADLHALDSIEAAALALAERGEAARAIEIVRPLLALRSAPTALFQRQVEIAYRAADPTLLVRAYLDLAAHLGEAGDPETLRVVFERVLELDPDNERAREALGFPRAPVLSDPADDGYIDLAALIMEDEPELVSTRFVVEAEPPTGDEDHDFAEILSRFREQVALNIAADDSASHYDLGVAFKEMGLWSDAASEFQAALRAGANPLATLEVLGECFVAQEQYAVGWRVLERAVRLSGSSDADMLGVLYWTARCDEALGRASEAAEGYERILAVDIRFRDAAERLRALPGAYPLPML